MENQYITFKPESEQELKKGIKEFQEQHPEINLYTYFRDYTELENLSDETEYGRALIILMQNQQGIPIELCNLMQKYIDFDRTHITVRVTLKDIQTENFEKYKNQIIKLSVTAEEAINENIQELVKKYKIEKVNELPLEEFNKRKEIYLQILQESDQIQGFDKLQKEDIFEDLCIPMYGINKEEFVEAIKQAIENYPMPISLFMRTIKLYGYTINPLFNRIIFCEIYSRRN